MSCVVADYDNVSLGYVLRILQCSTSPLIKKFFKFRILYSMKEDYLYVKECIYNLYYKFLELVLHTICIKVLQIDCMNDKQLHWLIFLLLGNLACRVMDNGFIIL